MRMIPNMLMTWKASVVVPIPQSVQLPSADVSIKAGQHHHDNRAHMVIPCRRIGSTMGLRL